MIDVTPPRFARSTLERSHADAPFVGVSITPPAAIFSAPAVVNIHPPAYAPPFSDGQVAIDPGVYSQLDQRPNPYLGFSRVFTEEGGIALSYQDVDESLLRTILRVCAWVAVMAATGWFILNASPVQHDFLNFVGFALMGFISALILFRDVHVWRTVEIRPDCMIIENEDVFWVDQMELGWPSFRLTDEGHLMLCGTYGTRNVEYLTIRHFDDNDRMPEVFSNHLQQAMHQQWSQRSRGIG